MLVPCRCDCHTDPLPYCDECCDGPVSLHEQLEATEAKLAEADLRIAQERNAKDAAAAAIVDLSAKLAEAERQREEWKARWVHVDMHLAAAESREKALRGALADARAALNRDRTGLAAALNQIETEIKGWQWLRPEGDGNEGGTWGSHPFQAHTQATLRQGIAWAFNAVLKIAADALRASGKLADEGCRQAGAALAAGEETLRP